MREGKSLSLSEVIQKLIKTESSFRHGFESARLLTEWEEIAGKVISDGTKKLEVKNSRLFVHFIGSEVRAEGMFLKSRWLNEIKKRFPDSQIDEIVLL